MNSAEIWFAYLPLQLPMSFDSPALITGLSCFYTGTGCNIIHVFHGEFEKTVTKTMCDKYLR